MREAYDANQKARRWPRHRVTVSEDATKTAEPAAPNCARENQRRTSVRTRGVRFCGGRGNMRCCRGIRSGGGRRGRDRMGTDPDYAERTGGKVC